MGEPAGIGGEIALKSWLRRGEGLPVFTVLDDPARLSALAARLGLPAQIAAIEAIEEAPGAFATALPVLAQPRVPEVEPGQVSGETAQAVIASIEHAARLTMNGGAAALVTNPIQKKALYESGFSFPGHTEFLGALSGSAEKPVMMLATAELRVVPVTIHVPLAEVPARLTAAGIVHAGRIAAAALQRDFGIVRPRLAVAGLNPHGGEGGTIGCEDETIVRPAVEELCRFGIAARGPLAADTMFHARARAGYDAALCMYHDQALIPLKTIDFEHSVNVTLGLPFVRTSPDHGTALDIAGRGIADPSSLMAALRLAASMAARRAAFAAR
jgi:4-hydroxythreonine-4-phosphate dehydrogenase